MDIIKSSLPRRPSIDCPLSPAPSSYPNILPHITLATVSLSDSGTLDVLLDAVPNNQHPIRVNFHSLVVGDHYFRSVFIDIQPTRELLDLQNEICIYLRQHGLEPSSPRFPHMSLCYIADEDKGLRDGTALALRDTGVVSKLDVDGQSRVALQSPWGEVSLLGFDGTEIWVVKCEGPVETWEVDERKVKLNLEF